MEPKRRRKIEFIELVFRFRENYKTATDSFSYLSPPCTTPTTASVRRRGHLAAHASRLRPKPAPRPWFARNRPSLAAPDLATRPRRRPCATRRRRRRAAPPPRRRLPWPGLPQAAVSQLALPLLPFLFKALQPSTRTPRAPQPPLPWLPSSARRGAPFSGHSLPTPTP